MTISEFAARAWAGAAIEGRPVAGRSSLAYCSAFALWPLAVILITASSGGCFRAFETRRHRHSGRVRSLEEHGAPSGF